MKAIPLIACLALAASQGRAQNAAPADTVASAPMPMELIGTRAKLYADIKSFRGETPGRTADIERRLEDIEKSVGDSKSPDDLAKTRKDFEALREASAPKPGSTNAAPNYFEKNRGQLQTIGAFSARNLTGARTDGSHYFDLSVRPAADAPGAFSAGANTKNLSIFSFVNAPAAPQGLHTDPPPALPDAGSFAADFHEWVQRNGISLFDYNILAQPAPPPPPPAPKPVMPSAEKPSTLAALEAWVDRTGISDAIIDKLKSIKVVGGDLLEGFGGYCYWGVKWMLTMVLPGVKQPKDLDLPAGDAYKLQLALKKDPKLAERLHLLPLDLRSVPADKADALPERTLLIWDRGCAGYSSISGHVEFTLHSDKMSRLDATAFYPLSRKYGFWVPNLDPKTEVLACSDGCEVQTMQKLRLYSGKCLSAYVPVVEPP
ncbi:MAG: hypothetical protein ACHQ2Z_04435 [Elusimicrobiota bacterium]